MKCILLHGLGQTASSWNDTVRILSNKYEILCPNLSDWLSNKTPCYDTLYQALERYCGQFHEPLHICGLSLGGILAIQYGIEHPENVKSLVLIGTQYVMPKRLLKLQNLMFRIMPRSSFENMGFQKTDFISLCNSMSELNFKDELEKILCPVLIVCGEKDKANKAASMGLQQQIKNAELVVIENTGHEINLENPIRLGEELKMFWNGTSSR